MSQEDRNQATNPPLRTQIEDLPPDPQELSEEEASHAAGGSPVSRAFQQPLPGPSATQMSAYTTGFQSSIAPDTDMVQDVSDTR
jgi:hypothetical protein